MPPRMYLAVAFAAFIPGLLFAMPATASTTIIEPADAHHPYQRWVDEALVPTPNLTITVTEGTAGCEYPGASACTDGYSELAIRVSYRENRRTFLHELGHGWDAETWDDGDRARYLRLIRQPRLPWWESEAAEDAAFVYWGSEWFADTYAICGVRRYFPKGTIYRAANGLVGSPAMRKICRLIRHLR